jgi:large subunit ribosomal protein L4
MKVNAYSLSGKQSGSVELDDSVFGIEPNVSVMHQAHLRQLANARLGTSDTKTRGQVSGGGRKPWRQKGTGRARQGSIRSPQWRGGGIVWGPHPRSYAQDMPKKMRRLAIRSAFSAKAQADAIVVVKGLYDIEPKTKAMRDLLAALPGSQRSTLIVIGPEQEADAVYRAGSNLDNIKVLRAGYANVHDLLKYERLVLTTEAVDTIHGLWALNEEAKSHGEPAQV